jgi:tetratricopeptide (TPR) repeat protein
LLVTWVKNLGLTTPQSREAFVERFVADTLKVSSLQNYLLQNVYETLEEKERRFTTVVSACRQRFDERDEDIEEILAEMGIDRVGDVVAGLVNKNLLTHLHQEGETLLHPIIREYFYRQTGLGERRWIHGRLAGYYEAHAEYLEAAYHHCRAGNWSSGVALIADNLEVLINSGQAQAALQQLARLDARRLSPADWGKVCQARGDLYGMAGRYAEAVASYQEALSLAPGALTTAELQRKMGAIWEKRGEHQRAMEYLQVGQQALTAEEGWPAWLERVRIAEQMAFVQRRQGAYQQAIALAHQALAWLDRLVVDSPDLGPVVRKERAALYDALGSSHFYQGAYPQAIEYWRKSLALRRDLADAYGIALSCYNLGLVYTRQSDFASAIRYCQESLQIRERIGDVWGSGASYNSLGILHYNLGAYPQALECYQKSLAILETIGDTIGVATCYNNLGDVYWRQSLYGQAQEYCRKSLAIREKIGDAYGLASTYTNLGSIARCQGLYAQAIAYQRQALTIKERIGDNWGLVVSYNELGRVYASQGDPQAVEYYQKGLKLAEEIGYALGVAHLYRSLGEMYYHQGDYPQATSYLQQVLDRCRLMGHKDLLSQAQALLGEVHLARGEPEKALAYAQESLQLAMEMGSQEGQGMAYRVLGQAWAGLGRSAEAEEAFQRSLEILEQVGNPLPTGEAWRSYGAFLRAQGQDERGQSYLRKALAIFEEIGTKRERDLTRSLCLLS